MANSRSDKHLDGLIRELMSVGECDYVEFKANNVEPQMIGQYISALSNSAAYNGQSFAYVVWGIEDVSYSVVGTDFNPSVAKARGNQALEPWLVSKLKPAVDFCFNSFVYEGKNVVVLEIDKAVICPVKFEGVAWIRLGESKKRLSECSGKEAELWRKLDNTHFLDKVAVEGLDFGGVLSVLNHEAYCRLLNNAEYSKEEDVVNRLVGDGFVKVNDAGHYDVTNLGAILFGNDLSRIKSLARKVVRVIEYVGDNRVDKKGEREFKRGYALVFEELIEHILSKVDSNEVIERVFRKDVKMYPPVAVRELVANMLIHQDFDVSGAFVCVEVFDRRIEIRNPGVPFVESERLLDLPPRYRNESLSGFMRRIGFCEERGSGIDRVVSWIEFFRLPAPIFRTDADFTSVTMFAHRNYGEMTKDEKLRACYLHACLKAVSYDYLTNSSLRERFGLDDSQTSRTAVSRLIGNAVKSGKIKLYDPNASNRDKKYVPYWGGSAP